MKNLKPKIAIVGGAGFIGGSLARFLSKKSQVEILDVRTPAKDLEDLVAFTHCDVRNYQEVADALDNVNLAIHVAIVQIPLINEHKSLGYAVNIVGTQNVCQAVEKIQKSRG